MDHRQLGLDDSLIEAVKAVTEKDMHPNQEKLDKNKNGKLDKDDFKILRGEKVKEEKKCNEDDDMEEGYKSHAQRKAVWASKNEKGVKEEVDTYDVGYNHGGLGKPKSNPHKPGTIEHKHYEDGYNQGKSDKKANEEFELDEEQLDELSKKTLGNYVKKASKSAKDFNKQAEKEYPSTVGYDLSKKGEKREIGVKMAANKLAKEETELDEATVQHSMGRYNVVHDDEVIATHSSKYVAQDHAKKINDDAKDKKRKQQRLAKEEVELDEEQLDEREESPTKGTRKVASYGDHSHTAEVRYSPEWEEYSVHHYKNGKHLGEGPVSYHGDDKDDAHGTAKHSVSVKEETEQIKEGARGTFRAGSKSYYKAGQTAIKNMRAAAKEREAREAAEKAKETETKKVDEEFELDEEQLDELDKKTLGSYVRKSTDQLKKHAVTSMTKFARGDKDALAYQLDPTSIRKTINREKGVDRALNRLTKEELNLEEYSLNEIEDFMMSEDYGQLDELSKKTLASYISKAAQSSRLKGQTATDFENRAKLAKKPQNKNTWEKLHMRWKKAAWDREDNITKAANKLAKEEVEQIEEFGPMGGDQRNRREPAGSTHHIVHVEVSKDDDKKEIKKIKIKNLAPNNWKQAKTKAANFYKKQGYTVHSTEHQKVVNDFGKEINEEVELTQEQIAEIEALATKYGIDKE